MDDSLHNENLLVRYLDGELTEAEKQSLEDRLRWDADLQQQLDSLRVAVQAIRQYGTRQQVDSLHAEMMHELKTKPKAKVIPIGKAVRYAMAVAASILVIFAGVKLYMAAQSSPEKIYSEAFVDFNTAATRGGSGDISVIEKAYQQKDYEAVVQHTRTIHMDAKDSLLIGLSYLHTDRTSQAIPFFRQMTNAENDYRQDAEFYLSLSYLRNKEYAKALQLMQGITSNPMHIYHEQIPNEVIEKVKDLME